MFDTCSALGVQFGVNFKAHKTVELTWPQTDMSKILYEHLAHVTVSTLLEGELIGESLQTDGRRSRLDMLFGQTLVPSGSPRLAVLASELAQWLGQANVRRACRPREPC